MKTRIYTFSKAGGCVASVVEIASDSDSDPAFHVVPPSGSPEIILYAGASRQIKNVPAAGGVIKGLYTTTTKIDFEPGYHFLVIRLQPYGLKQLFDFNAHDLHNAVLDVQEHPVSAALMELSGGLNEITVPLIRRLVAFLEARAVYPVSQATRAFVQRATGTGPKVIKDMLRESGIGQRTLQRHFKREVGLTPKEYLRILRLTAVEDRMARQAGVFELIADFEFTDQAHFIKAFKQLRSVTPAEVVKKKLLLSDQLARPEIVQV